ncbi:Tll0287-like domain-containing protein [Pelagicoccus albus]|uniref:DUF3365 domain-containing protein n=1 Tax=Pelagicoccus albus TaxID=415222 RepID=A0A7X1B2Y6_9BACT|nr:DUF3365 domain-containing protein [Pelagicoccus albus]MBC2604690.1 DUF3365 domain-containing protein [Pelagicoccus albus]
MNKKTLAYVALLACATVPSTLILSGCAGSADAATGGISPQKMADGLHLVMKSDRTVYTRNVVNRLVKQDKVIAASEHWADDKALPLPAQMFRMGAEMVAKEADAGFSYSLQSIWPINKQNAPKTEAEKAGLQFVIDNPGENYYAEETLGGVNYFTGVYADTGVAAACVDCHNEHKDSPKTDFKLGDVMGGVVIRIPLD